MHHSDSIVVSKTVACIQGEEGGWKEIGLRPRYVIHTKSKDCLAIAIPVTSISNELFEGGNKMPKAI